MEVDANSLEQKKVKLCERIEVQFIKQTRHWFLDVSLVFPAGINYKLSESEFKLQILKSLKQFFGEVGAAIRVDILKYNTSNRLAVLKCLSDDFVKVRSALITVTEYSKAECFFKVHRVAASLLSLTASSRTFEF